MSALIKIIIVQISILLLMPLNADMVNKNICAKGNLKRIITHTAENNTGLPCAVIYEKPQEGGYKKPLWMAQNEEGYCAKNYKKFTSKLIGMGWDCSQSDYSPTIQVVYKDQFYGRIFTSNYDFVGHVNDYFELKNGENEFIIHGDYHARMNITVKLEQTASLKNIEARDGFGCPEPGEVPPKNSLVKWTTSKLKRVNNNLYRITLNSAKYKSREPLECSSIPSEVSGLKWKNTKMTIKSNLSDAVIYQETKSGRYEILDSVKVGMLFSAIHRENDDSVRFVLKKSGYANCVLLVPLPISEPGKNVCNFVKIQGS